MRELSVVITTRNRRAAVTRAVRSVLSQQQITSDVIVYDDASEDDTTHALRSAFPGVTVVRGATRVERLVARNAAARLARHTFVLFLDDDCFLTDPTQLERALALFDDAPKVAVVCMPLVEPNRIRTGSYDWCRASRGQLMGSFLAGASIFRKSAYEGAGGYREILVHHVEEKDLALRLLDSGWQFVYAGGPPLIHLQAATRSSDPEYVRRYAQNTLLVSYLTSPLHVLAPRLLSSTLRFVFTAFPESPLRTRLAGVCDGMRACWRLRQQRRPVSAHAYRIHRSLPQHGPERSAIPQAT